MTDSARGWWWPLSLGLAAIHVWLAARMPLTAVPPAGHDDALFIRLGMEMLNGQWLGPYTQMTLAKGPFYPLFVAVAAFLGLPILAAQALVHAAAALVLARALRPWLGGDVAALLLFLLVLANPLGFASDQMRVIREGLYTPLTLLVLGLAVWAVRLRHGPLRPALLAASGLGASLAGFWLTREEGPWLLPALLAALLLALAHDARDAGRALRWRRTLASAGLALLVASAGVGLFKAANWLRYGVADIVEFKQREFVSAYAALTRITPPGPVGRHVVATPETLALAFAASPAAAELAAPLASPLHTGFIAHGCEVYQVSPCDGASRAAWFMWALREAAAAAGMHRDARTARAFYGRLAAEVNAACEAGRIPCAPARHGMAPPFDWRALPAKLDRMWEGLRLLALLPGVAPPREALSCYTENCGASSPTGRFLSAVHSTLFQPLPMLEMVGFRRAETPPPPSLDILAYQALRRPLAAAIEAYRVLVMALLALALPSLVLALLLAWRRRRAEPLLAVALLAGLAVLSRAFLLAWLDVAAMPGINTLYLWPAQPPLAVFALCAPLALWRLWRGPRLSPGSSSPA
ncbi:MAG: hypothetical protein N3D18_15225 [Roseococcus sp.]|nr:hypothetical protein [Roseococcus sp.]